MSGRTLGLILAGGRSRRMGRDKAFVPLAGQPLLAHVIARLAPQVDALVISSNAPPEHFAAFHLPVLADIHGGFRGPLAGVHAALAAYPDDVVVSVAVDLPLLPPDLVERLKQGWDGTRCRYAARGCASAANRSDPQGRGEVGQRPLPASLPRAALVHPAHRREHDYREVGGRVTPGAVTELPGRAGAAIGQGAEHALAILWPPHRAAALEHYLRTASHVSGWLAAQGEPVQFPPKSTAALDINLNTPADLARIEALLAHPAR